MHRRTFLTGAAASLLSPLILNPKSAAAQALFMPPAMVQRNPYYPPGSSPVSLQFDVDPSWYGVVNKVQPPDGSQVDIFFPPISSMTAPTFIGIYPCFDAGDTIIHPSGDDTICGNPGPWHMKQDENFGFVADFPLMTGSQLGSGDASNWSILGSRNRLRQGFIPNVITAQNHMSPTGDNWVPVPGWICGPRAPLQSPSSRIRIDCSISISSTNALDRMAFSLVVPGFGLVTPPLSCGGGCPGVEGLASSRTPYTSDSIQYNFFWEQPPACPPPPPAHNSNDVTCSPNGGFLVNLFTSANDYVQLMVKNSDPGGTMVLNPAATVSAMTFQEFSVA